MTEWLGIEHLFELEGAEVVWGFLTPLLVFIAFFVVQLILPGRWVPGYVTNPETGEPRNYRLNGILVFVIAVIVWATELTGMPRDWFYRSSAYAAAGGTLLTVVMTAVAVFTQPQGEVKNRFLAWWFGRTQEIQFFSGRVDVKMYFYVVGGTMLVLNAWSGAAYHHDRFADDANPGVFLYAAFLSFYVFDYFVFERVQLYTYDVIHERLGFKMFWGGLMVYGWLYILPLWGLAAHPDPGFSGVGRYVWLIGAPALYFCGWCITRGANMQKYTFKRWPERKFLGFMEPQYIQAGDRKILCSGLWGYARHFNYFGEWCFGLAIASVFGHFTNLWAWSYFACILALFIYRQLDDDKHCAEKYGAEKWEEYKSRVKYRIVPGIY
ncbi:MAG: DUF1295 domain-containing protein [Acidimicrobiaceae bacterium]|nr:DUF1295 domain-containing protein [Acidimicrobiaceae bacterium]MYA73997.1 DUF1295 domain-containing protein [Acidimicrobiaceae bacterium]MYC42725.1 DUF1295 domain-containing protein [Acidimicrobiaceae bacterium]MYG55879.1 DUF1295 domain-containing protein [Acidimicrobiaceae bacterium]MYH88908.1 DUF1295 domain-containing protein [Acidimicrobiaceae bacterium]